MNQQKLENVRSAMRARSWAVVTRFGLERNEYLPLLDDLVVAVSGLAVRDRLLCLHAVASSAFGVPSAIVNKWVADEGIASSLSPVERRFLGGDQSLLFQAQSSVDSAYALAWAASLVPDEKLMTDLPKDFIKIFPDIRKRESAASFGRSIKFRDVEVIASYLDLCYCLHWALRDAQMRLEKSKHLGQLPFVVAQRKALEWVVTGTDWDDVSLDT
jgi:hypothetical protein